MLAAAETALGLRFVPDGILSSLTESPLRIAAPVGAAMLLAALASAFVRFPTVVPVAILVTAPFRLPLEIDAENPFFVGLGDAGELGRLLPLYAVLAAAAAALVYRALTSESSLPALPRGLAVPAALFLALSAVSLTWALDVEAATDELVFFLLPFTVLLAVVARSPFPPGLPRALAIALVGIGCVSAAVGIFQEATRTLFFFDPKVEIANAYAGFFRVTAFFTDPSIYGRYLVVAIVVVLVALWTARIGLLLGTALVALLWVGLFFAYSQSSLAALAVATLVVTWLAADARSRRIVAAGTALLVIAAAAALVSTAWGANADRVTSGRAGLAAEAAEAFGKEPLLGVGIGSQPAASAETNREAAERRSVSHTTPLRVTAELGIVGLTAYLALLVAVGRLALSVRQRDDTLGLALVGVLVALFVHSLAYGGFFEDPFMWGALGVAAARLSPRARTVEWVVPAEEPRPTPAASS